MNQALETWERQHGANHEAKATHENLGEELSRCQGQHEDLEKRYQAHAQETQQEFEAQLAESRALRTELCSELLSTKQDLGASIKATSDTCSIMQQQRSQDNDRGDQRLARIEATQSEHLSTLDTLTGEMQEQLRRVEE